MDLRLTDRQLDLQRRARALTDEVLLPLEEDCEANDGLSPEQHAAAKAEVLARGFHAINHAVEDGGRGLDLFDQMLVEALRPDIEREIEAAVAFAEASPAPGRAELLTDVI